MANVLIAGCGYVGTALGIRLAHLGHRVWGMRRRSADVPPPIHALKADLVDPGTLGVVPSDIDVVFYTASPDRFDEACYRATYVDGLRNLLAALKSQRQCPRVLYTSSTAVYAQQSGEWVDESSPTTPEYFAGRCLLEGEQRLLESGLRATVVRLGGIYGLGRTRLIQAIKTGSATYQDGPRRYMNHIHQDDCVGVLVHLMMSEQSDAVYLGVDHEPVDRREVLIWLADQLGASPPRCDSSLSGESRRTKNNKRCRNTKIVDSGYVFRYPTFREGYATMLTGMSIHG